jgi:tetratricopeptide (TPR) repeat protein
VIEICVEPTTYIFTLGARIMDDVRKMEAQAFAAEKAEDFERAILIWNQILELYPRWELGFTHYNLAGCYEETGQIDLAIETYRKAIEISPKDPMFSDALESLLEARSMGKI